LRLSAFLEPCILIATLSLAVSRRSFRQPFKLLLRHRPQMVENQPPEVGDLSDDHRGSRRNAGSRNAGINQCSHYGFGQCSMDSKRVSMGSNTVALARVL